jgi:acetyltransferase-like isoleucine patch superfamily enzyme
VPARSIAAGAPARVLKAIEWGSGRPTSTR